MAKGRPNDPAKNERGTQNEISHLQKFLTDYSAVIGAFVGLYLLGNLFAPLSWLVGLGIMAYWAAKGKDDYLVIMLILILVMGDSRAYYFSHVKNLRIVAILVIGIRTFAEISHGKYRFRAVFLWCIPFFIVALIGGLRSPSLGTSISKMISYFLLIVVVLHYLPYHFQNHKHLLADVAILGMWILLLGLLARFVNPSLTSLLERFRGLLGNPNGLGIYATLLFVICLICFELYPESKRRWQLGMGLLLFSVILSGSRTALGTIGIFYFLYWFHKRNPGSIVALWGFVIPVLIVFFSFLSPTDLIRMIGLGEFLRVESIETGTGRFLAWTLGWNQILQNPFIGKGFAYEEIYFHSLADVLVATEHQGGMHNSWLTFMMNNGLIGFCFFLIFLINLLTRMKSRAFALPFTLAALVSATFESWLNSSLNAFSIHFFLVVVILIDWPQYLEIRDKRLAAA